MCLVICLDALGKPRSCATREVNHSAEIFPIHYLQQFFRAGEKLTFLRHGDTFVTLGRERQVCVNIDDRKASALHSMRSLMQHASRFEISQIKPGLLP